MNPEEIAKQPVADQRSSYIKWVESEGIPRVRGFFIDDVKRVLLCSDSTTPGVWEAVSIV